MNAVLLMLSLALPIAGSVRTPTLLIVGTTRSSPAPIGGDTRSPDRVVLNDGTKLEGRVVFEDYKTLILRNGTRDRELAKSEIGEVESRSARLREALERWLKLSPSDVRAVLDLAQYCQRTELFDEARLFAMQALTLDAANEDAHALLGHEQRSNGWCMRVKTGWVPFAQLSAARADWDDAADFPSSHFRLRTNLGLREAVSTALDLECYYHAFYAQFASELRLLDVVEPMPAEVHADAKSYPEIAGKRRAYFDDGAFTLQVNAAGGLQRGDIFHEATHELLFFTSERTKASVGKIPAWLQEGLAEYASAGMIGNPGRPRFTPDNIHERHFHAHAVAKDPYSLNRVLNFDTNDFLASSGTELKYAQAYTLVHFGLHGDGGTYRASLLEFLRGAYKGQASTTHFKEAFGERSKDLERTWTAYAREIAGAKPK